MTQDIKFTYQGGEEKVTLTVYCEMRNWLLDCVYDDDDIDYILGLQCCEVCDLIDRNYVGGVESFILACE